MYTLLMCCGVVLSTVRLICDNHLLNLMLLTTQCFDLHAGVHPGFTPLDAHTSTPVLSTQALPVIPWESYHYPLQVGTGE